MTVIAVDAMGGDNAPVAVVSGAVRAAQRGIAICLFGKEQVISSILFSLCPQWQESFPITIVDCPENVPMETVSVKHIVRQKMSSIAVAMEQLKSKKISAFVSAGNSIAVHALATLVVGRVPGILRPAIGSFFPTINNGQVYCLDLGANTDCKPVYLEQFAHMATLYLREFFGIAHPRVGLLSNGHEPYKGSLLIKETFARLSSAPSLNFVGNVEARDLFQGYVDIIVCDGFVGNVALKTAQGTVKALMQMLAQEAQQSYLSKFLLMLSSGILKKVKSKLDYTRTGGALLLGVNEPVIIAHGSSNEQAIENAIVFAHELVISGCVKSFNYKVERTINVSMNYDSRIERIAQNYK